MGGLPTPLVVLCAGGMHLLQALQKGQLVFQFFFFNIWLPIICPNSPCTQLFLVPVISLYFVAQEIFVCVQALQPLQQRVPGPARLSRARTQEVVTEYVQELATVISAGKGQRRGPVQPAGPPPRWHGQELTPGTLCRSVVFLI